MTTYPNFDPTALYAGEGSYRSSPIIVAQANAITKRGTLLGRVAEATGAGAAVVAAVAGNTGNGSLTADVANPVQAYVKSGAYVVKYTAPTTFDVFDPEGRRLASGTNGVTYNDQIKFVAAAGATAFVAGDSFTVTIPSPNVYVPCVKTAIDGSQIPSVVLAADLDTTGGPASGPAYFDGTFAFESMIVDPSWTYSTLRAALQQFNSQIDVRSVGPLG